MIECPYCEKDVLPVDDCREQDEPHENECGHCEKAFIYYVEYYPSYSSQKAPCLNGEPHDYQDINGYPVEFFKNKRRCSYCSDEITLEKTPTHHATIAQ